ncbi:MAG TPA: hypothetical protein VFW83_05040 [Bryobacteraceae bacterium]|nr:hypothetical protein [Bryobacteraceae bacterium]
MTPAYRASFQLQQDLRRVRLYVLVAGAVLLAAPVAGAFFSPGDFFHAYLIGYLFWIGISLGSMAFLMIQYLTGGAWGVVTRRTLEAATRTLPVIAILFIPIGFGIQYLYPWAQPDQVAQIKTLQHNHGYLNADFFFARAGIYLIVWMVFAYFLNRWSSDQDRNPGNQPSRLAKLSAPGLIFYMFSLTFAAIDWAESLQPEWASTIWGFMFIAAEAITTLGFVILVLTFLSRREPMSNALKPDHFLELGTMLFAALMLWAYFAFVQYLIVWSENLPSEISYYLPRTGTSWGWLGLCLIVVQFAIPAVLLLSRWLKRNAYALSAVVILVLVMRYMDLIWIVLPGYYKDGFRIQWMDVLTPLGIGGLWLWAFLRELPRFPLLPWNAPELEEALAHGSQ